MSAGPGSLAAALAAFARPELSPEHAEITFTAAALGSHEHGPLAMSRCVRPRFRGGITTAS